MSSLLGAAPRTRVAFHSEGDIEYWTRHFDASHYRIWRALCEVGDDPFAVWRYLDGGA